MIVSPKGTDEEFEVTAEMMIHETMDDETTLAVEEALQTEEEDVEELSELLQVMTWLFQHVTIICLSNFPTCVVCRHKRVMPNAKSVWLWLATIFVAFCHKKIVKSKQQLEC